MTPRLVTCYDGARYHRLARVLVSTAETYAPGWAVDCVERRLLPNDATKLLFWCEALEAAPDGTPLCLIDCDTFLTGMLDPIWEQPFEIAYTARHPKHSRWHVNAGVLFVRASDGVRAFFRDWLREERRLLLTTGRTRQNYLEKFGAVSQAAFEQLRAKSSLQILGVPCQQWNCEDSEWKFFDATTKIVHVKGAFRDAIFMGKIKDSRKQELKPLLAAWKKAEALLVGPTALYTPAWQQTREPLHDGTRLCFRQTLKEFGTPLALLDVGCGDGTVLDTARSAYIESLGLDISPPAAPVPGLQMADLRDPVDLQRAFPMVLCWELAEHLPIEAADTLCDTLTTHLAPGGDLIFTAAAPGQGGHGHVNEQPAAYWREKLAARGLTFDAFRTKRLAEAWKGATDTPWYAANVQVFRRPAPDAHPGLAVSMRTAARKKSNYVGKTLRSLQAQGMDVSRLHLALTAPGTDWLAAELRHVPTPILHVPTKKLNPNENALQQLRAAVETGSAWVLLLEDDLTVCADFLGSVERWLGRSARGDRHVYRFFGFTTPPNPNLAAYDWPLESLRGSQAIALRRADAEAFLAWGTAHLRTWRREAPWKSSGADPGIAFDKFVACWALLTWPKVPGVMSHPYFVNHIGNDSSIHARGVRNDRPFAGAAWRYEATA